LLEDTVGEGKRIAFPRMSTCVAVAAVLDDRLVAGHFSVVGSYATMSGSLTHSTQQAFEHMQALIARDPIRQLYIVGFTTNHDPQLSRTKLGWGPESGVEVLCYDISRKEMTEVCILMTHNGKGTPKIEAADNRLVTATMREQRAGDEYGYGREGRVTYPSAHR